MKQALEQVGMTLTVLFLTLGLLMVGGLYTPTGGAELVSVKLDKFTNLYVVNYSVTSVSEDAEFWYVELSDGSTKQIPKANIERKIATFLGDYTSPKEAEKTARLLVRDSDRPSLFTCMAVAETGCDSTKISPMGAQGKWQVMPSWKRVEGFEFYRKKDSHLDDSLNLRAAQKVFKLGLDKTGDIWKAVYQYCGSGPEASAYVKKVKLLYAKLNCVEPKVTHVWIK